MRAEVSQKMPSPNLINMDIIFLTVSYGDAYKHA